MTVRPNHARNLVKSDQRDQYRARRLERRGAATVSKRSADHGYASQHEHDCHADVRNRQQCAQFTLGFVLVVCFSIGLALTLVTVGAAAALSVQHATRRWSWFSTFARRAPYFSSIVITAGLV
jgi:hypothetical protein